MNWEVAIFGLFLILSIGSIAVFIDARDSSTSALIVGLFEVIPVLIVASLAILAMIALSLLLIHGSELFDETPEEKPPKPRFDFYTPGGVSAADILKELSWGEIYFAVSENMELGEIYTVLLEIKPQLTTLEIQTAFDKPFADKFDKEVIFKETIKITNQMRSELKGHSFQITEIHPAQQNIEVAERTSWLWQVEPKKTGAQNLYLSIQAIVDLVGEERPIVLRSYQREVKVDVSIGNVLKRFFSDNWQWVWAVFFVPLAGLVWRKIQLFRLKNAPAREKRIWTPD